MSDVDILARIRTLLALERNYLAEERTVYAEFRTGLELAVIGPPATAGFALFFASIQIESPFFLDLIVLAFFSALTIIGIRMIIHARPKLNKIRNRKKILKDRITEVIKSSKTVYDLFSDGIGFDDE